MTAQRDHKIFTGYIRHEIKLVVTVDLLNSIISARCFTNSKNIANKVFPTTVH